MFWKTLFSLLYLSPYEFNFVGNLSHMFLIYLYLTPEKLVFVTIAIACSKKILVF